MGLGLRRRISSKCVERTSLMERKLVISIIRLASEMLLAFRYNRHHGGKKDAISINKKNVSLTDSWWLSRKYSPA